MEDLASQDICIPTCQARKSDLGYPLPLTRQAEIDKPIQNWLRAVAKNTGSQEHHSLLVYHAGMQSGAPTIHFPSINAALQLFGPMQQHNYIKCVCRLVQRQSARSDDC